MHGCLGSRRNRPIPADLLAWVARTRFCSKSTSASPGGKCSQRRRPYWPQGRNAVARLIPADELGPGAKEAGVALFIDHQLAGAWGTMARNYRQGPWPEGTPQQGYQSPLTPQEVYRAAIREVNQQCTKQYGKAFA